MMVIVMIILLVNNTQNINRINVSACLVVWRQSSANASA
jgi:hypothetical protein